MIIRDAQMDQMAQTAPERPLVMPCKNEKVCPLIHLEEEMPQAAPEVGAAAVKDAPAHPPQAKAPAGPAAPAAPPAPPPPVAPAVTSAGVVVVKKPHTNPARVRVLLKTDKAFTGKGTFTAAPADTILFFHAKTGGAAIKFDGKDNVFPGAALTSGLTLYAQGAKASTAMNDVTISLNLAGGSKTIVKSPSQAKMTAVDVSLEICKPRTAAGADPPQLSEAAKVDPGRAIHVQDAGKHLRAMLIVMPVKPPDFKGQLKLATDFTGKGSVVLFPNETATANELPSNEMDVPAAGSKVFAEGIGISGKVKDVRIKLGIAGLEADADHVFVTVIEAKLDICKPRQAAGKEPDPLAQGDKQGSGRMVHLQDTTHRAMLIVHQVKPADFVGKLVLTPLATGAGNVQVFLNETGGAALGTPLQIDHGAKFPAAGLKRFAEGSVLSGNLGDTGFQLGVQDVEDKCDAVAVTVVSVASLLASLPSTKNASTGVAPPDGTFPTPNAALAFAADVVVVLNAGDITVKAVNIQPPAAKDLLRWQIDQDPSDTVAKAIPPLDKPIGEQVKVTPNTPGTFRLICYSNGNDKHVPGEEFRVLRFVVVKITPQPGGAITINNAPNVFFPGVTGNGVQTGIGAIPTMSLLVDFLLEGGGANRRVGVGQVVIGNVGNLATSPGDDSFVVNYPGVPAPGDPRNGTESEDPDFFINPAAGFAAPMVDTHRIVRGAVPTGGSSPFRTNSLPPAVLPNGPGGNGQRVRVTSLDSPAFGWAGNHPTTGNPWATTQGANVFTEWVVAYSKDFPTNYVALGKGGYSVTVIGTNSGGGQWADNGSSVGVTPWSTAGFPKTGDAAGVQILGPSFVMENSMIVKP